MKDSRWAIFERLNEFPVVSYSSYSIIILDLKFSSVDPDSKYNVYCTGVQHGSTADWNTVWERLQTVTNSLGMYN